MNPYRTLVSCSLLAAAALGQDPGPAAISWTTSLDAARAVAAREKKPILLLHLLGRLDEERC